MYANALISVLPLPAGDRTDDFCSLKIISGLELRVRNRKIIVLFLYQTYVVGTQKNRLEDMVLLSTQNIC